MLIVITDICTADSSNIYNGGRESFLRNLYSHSKEEIVEISFFGNPSNNLRKENVKYNKIISLLELVEHVRADDVLYFNMLFSKRDNFAHLKKIFPHIQANYKIMQQHLSFERYLKFNKHWGEIVDYFDHFFLYSEQDSKTWPIKSKSFSTFLITSEVYESLENRCTKNGKFVLYSGRSDLKCVKEILKYRKIIEKNKLKLRFSFNIEDAEVSSLLKKKGVEFTIGDSINERYNRTKLLLQTDNKGYGLSIIESLKFGVPSAVMVDFPCSKYFVTSKKFIFKNKRGLGKLLSSEEEWQSICEKCFELSKAFDGQNKLLLSELNRRSKK